MDWKTMFWDKCREIQELTREVNILQTILRSYIPIIGDKGDIDERISNS